MGLLSGEKGLEFYGMEMSPLRGWPLILASLYPALTRWATEMSPLRG